MKKEPYAFLKYVLPLLLGGVGLGIEIVVMNQLMLGLFSLIVIVSCYNLWTKLNK